MSDNPAPPKKVGSLRDRIAAFEKPQASSSGPTPPPPRPKPGGLVGQWKPKQLERVGPSTEDSDTDKGGMTADDARHSISRGGGLKERMAALQGKGGFGAPADSSASKAPPLPSEQGKARVWRPVVDLPPPTAATHDEYNDDATALPTSDDATKGENVDSDNEPKTEDDLERERRAAIAARMAKLGGARVGMGPPIFGKKPVIGPKPKLPAKDDEKAAEDAPATAPIPTETVTVPPIPAPKRTDTLEKASSIPLPTTGDDDEATSEEPKKSSAPSLTVPIPEEGRQRTISGSQRSPISMPAPAIPRRAAPPRRKQAPPPPPEPESEPAPIEPAPVELLASASDTPASEAVPVDEGESILEAAMPPPASASPSPSLAAQAEDSLPHDAAIKVEPPTPHVSAFANTQTTAEENEEAEAEDELDRQEPDDEHEENPEERRNRIAEKLKEMGAVNPLAGKLGEPAQLEVAAPKSDAKMDTDAQEAVPTDQYNAHGHHDEDGSEVDYPGGSVASPTSPTRTAPVPPMPMSVSPPPPLRQPVDVEKEYEGNDHNKSSGKFADEERNVFSAADVDDEDEFKKDIQVLSASRQWAEDGGDEGEDSSIYPLRAATFTPDDSAFATPATPAPLPPPHVPSASHPLLSGAVHSKKKPRPLSMTRHNRPIPPPPAPPPVEALPSPPQQQPVEHTIEGDEEGGELDQPLSLTAALNAALARRPPVPRMSFDAESAAQVSPTSPTPAVNRPPPPPPALVRSGSIPKPEFQAVDDSDDEELNNTDEEPSPPPPLVPARTRSPPPVPAGIMSPIMVNTPPPTAPQRIIVPDTPIEELEEQKVRMGIKKPALPPPMWDEFMPESPKAVRGKRSREVMDDEDIDPIDPNFVLQSRSSPASPQEEVNQPPPQEQEEDPETVRKKTIAERMAKLGGIRFGAPMPPVKVAPPKPVVEETKDQNQDAAAPSAQTDRAAYSAAEGPEDEDETARRRRIAAKVAAMGGRGLGMGMFGIAPPPAPVHAPKEEDVKPNHELGSPPPVPTARLAPKPPVPAVNRPPPPPPALQDEESEIEIVEGHEETDDEGEEIHAEEITEDEEPEMVEVPPPPPPRSGRPPVPKGSLPPPPPPPASVRRDSHDSKSASPPPLPGGRRTSVQPPIRTTPSIPAPISNTVRLKSQSPPRVLALASSVGAPPPPPPPPPPSAKMVGPAVMYSQQSRPTRTMPAPISPIESPAIAESGKQQQHPWELPSIPSGSFDLGSRPEESMQMSWTEVGGASSSAQTELHTYPPGSSSNYSPFAGSTPATLGPEALAALAQRLNPRIIDSTHSIHEKSKKNVIGDGSSLGFLQQVLTTVPTASAESLGHLIYAQTGASVTRRAGDIVPGDIIALYDAKFKGHKGLSSYSIVVGSADDPLLGIVSDFSASGKRAKLKAFAVNQLPNAYPTIVSPSYKLEDLKSGTIKVFRIAEI